MGLVARSFLIKYEAHTTKFVLTFLSLSFFSVDSRCPSFFAHHNEIYNVLTLCRSRLFFSAFRALCLSSRNVYCIRRCNGTCGCGRLLFAGNGLLLRWRRLPLFQPGRATAHIKGPVWYFGRADPPCGSRRGRSSGEKSKNPTYFFFLLSFSLLFLCGFPLSSLFCAPQ